MMTAKEMRQPSAEVQVPCTQEDRHDESGTQETNYGTPALDDDLPMMTKSEIRTTPVFGKHIVRPESKHGELNAGFTFAKAGHTPNASGTPQVRSSTPSNERKSSPPFVQSPRQVAEGTRNGLTMPFPTAETAHGTSSDPAQTTAGRTITHTHQVTPLADTMTEQVVDKVKEPDHQAVTFQDTMANPSTESITKPNPSVEEKQSNEPGSNTKLPVESTRKSPPNKRPAVDSTDDQPVVRTVKHPSTNQASQSAVSQVHRYYFEQNELQQRSLAEAFASLEEKAAENSELFDKLQILAQEYKKLQHELQSKKESISSHDQEVRKYEEARRKLNDYVKGLSNDYNQLQDVIKQLQEKHDGLESGFSTEAAHAHQVAKDYASQVNDLRDIIKTLQNERDTRSLVASPPSIPQEKIEEAFTNKLSEMQQGYTEHCRQINDKLAELLTKPNHCTAVQPQPQANLVALLENCSYRINDLQKRQNVGPGDLQRLECAMHYYAHSVQTSLEDYDKRSTNAEEAQRKLSLAVQADIQKIFNNTCTNSTLQEQVIQYREAKAAATEELRGANLQLIEARCEVNNLRERQAEHSQAVQRLEAKLETANQPQDHAPEILLRISELQDANKDLEAERMLAEGKVSSMLEQLQQQELEVEKIHNERSGLQMQYEQAMAQAALAHTERDECISRSDGQRKAADTQANEAAKLTLASWEKKVENERKHLQAKLHQAEVKIESLRAEQPKATSSEEDPVTVKRLEEKLLAYETKEGKEREEIESLKSQLEEEHVNRMGLEARVEEVQKKLDMANVRRGQKALRNTVEDSQPRYTAPVTANDSFIRSPGNHAGSEIDASDWFHQQDAMRQLQLEHESTRTRSYTKIVTGNGKPGPKRAVIEDSQDKNDPKIESQGSLASLPSALRSSRNLSASQESVTSDLGNMRPPMKKVKVKTESQASGKSVSFASSQSPRGKLVSGRKSSTVKRTKENRMNARFAQETFVPQMA